MLYSKAPGLMDFMRWTCAAALTSVAMRMSSISSADLTGRTKLSALDTPTR